MIEKDMIEAILKERYGTTILTASPYAILWAADCIEKAATARKALEQANRIRLRHGQIPVWAPYGHRLF